MKGETMCCHAQYDTNSSNFERLFGAPRFRRCGLQEKSKQWRFLARDRQQQYSLIPMNARV
jgi:hypothetical protein